MAKIYKCSACGSEYTRWIAGCKNKNCNEYGTLEEVESGSVSTHEKSGLKSGAAVTPVKKASTLNKLNSQKVERIPTGIEELDRVLGGGFVSSEVLLLAGTPGAGKSTLSLSIADALGKHGKVLYSSGEESEEQIGLRAKRMEIENNNIFVIHETNLETLLGHINEEKPSFLIVDSLQTLASSELKGSIGDIQQSKEAAYVLTRLAKNEDITMVLISQVLKSGDMAGSESIQHIVDATVMLEADNASPLKFLTANKNRFGSTSEVGVFQHTGRGLEEVSDPSGLFVEDGLEKGLSGTAYTFIRKGVRNIAVQVQALVSTSTLTNPRRQFNGVDYNRGQIVAAILDKFCKAKLYEKDIFLNTVAGIKIYDPQADLAIAAAMLSSVHDKTFPDNIFFIGELDLTGQIRSSFEIESKVKEADRLGFDTIVLPLSAKNKLNYVRISSELKYISSVKALNQFLI